MKASLLKKLITALLCIILAFSPLSIINAFAEERYYVGDDGITYYMYYPDTPTNFTPTKVTQTSVTVKWDKDYNYEENGYEVCFYNPSTKEYTHIANTRNASYKIKNLKPDTVYRIAVREYQEYKDYDTSPYLYGNFSKTLTVRTAPKAVSLKKATYKKSGKIELGWSKVQNVSGYLIQYSTSKSFAEKNTCTLVITDNSYVKKTVNGLFATTYYIRMCSYRTAGGRKFCSKWGGVKTVKVKKGVSLKAAINSTKTDLSGRNNIKSLTNNGVDIKKYSTTYDRFKAIYNWHAKNYKKFDNCVECNGSFADCVNSLYAGKKKYDDFIWLASDRLKSNGKVVQHKWCVIYINGVHLIFDPRLQGYTGNYTGTQYFGKTKGSATGKKYIFDEWYMHFRYGYKKCGSIITE